MKKITEDPRATWEKLSPRLDQALLKLPERYQRAIILRYLEGHSSAAAASLLGVPENTFASWVHRGMEQLRARLGGEGVALSVAGLSQLLEGHTAAMPDGLVSAVNQLAAAGAAGAGAGAVVAPQVQAAMEGMLKAAFWSKAKVAVAGVFLSAAVGATAALSLVGAQGGKLAGKAPLEETGDKAPQATPAAPAEHLILDHTAYWRYFLVSRPPYVSCDILKAEGEKLFDKEYYARLQKGVERRLKRENRTLDDWRKEVTYEFGTGDGRSVTYYDLIGSVRTTTPPENWTAPEFEDGDWTRQREPFMLGRASRGGWGGTVQPSVQLGCYRTAFELPDLAGVKQLTMSLVYRGGVRVFLNGQEVLRGHLPPGEIRADMELNGSDYPSEAYILEAAEYKIIYGQPHPSRIFILPELLGKFEDAEGDKGDLVKPRRYRAGGDVDFMISPKGWESMQKRRNRSADVALPLSLLRKGKNHLAIEIRGSRMHPVVLRGDGNTFQHSAITRLELRAGAAGLPSGVARPAGAQVWVEDIHHRVFSPEFAPRGSGVGKTTMVGAKNGVYAAQVVVGTDKELSGLKATLGDLKLSGGAGGIPAASAQVLYGVPHPASELVALGEYKSADTGVREGFGDESQAIIDRHGSYDAAKPDRGMAILEGLRKVQYFDHLQAAPPEKIPANSCQPVWISLTVPPQAAAGKYTGSIKVEAAGMAAVDVPLELEVIDWRLPEAKDLQPIMALEQSPYGVARRYKAPLWSDQHFQLIEKSFALLGKVGNDWLNVPLLAFSEYGNHDDSMVRITRRKDGTYACDLSIMDRYLDMAVKHCGMPRIVDFVVNQPGAAGSGPIVPPLEMAILDEASGKKEVVNVGSKMPSAERRALWQSLSTTLYQRMKERGMEKAMYWGLPWDAECDPGLPKYLAQFVPDVKWARLSHGFTPDATFVAVATLFGHTLGLQSQKGWKSPIIHMLYPRNQGSVITCFGTATPFTYRLMMDRLLVAGASGVARLGADYWEFIWLSGWKGQIWMPGLPCRNLFYPGPEGAETSVRFEMLREGLQEAELRCFLEQAAEKLDNAELKERITKVLERHSHDTMIMGPREPYAKLAEYSTGWQVRSRKLYLLAAEVSQKIGVDMPKSEIAVSVPARGKADVNVRLRNWTGQARAWKVAAAQEWIKPAKTEGKLEGQEDLKLTLDGSNLPAEKEALGTLTLTDASGRAETLQIKAQSGKVLALSGADTVLNVATGSKESIAYTLFNHSGAEINWNAAISVPWISAQPASGTLAPRSPLTIILTASPPDKERARHEAKLTLSEAGGVKQELPLVVHVVPPYQAPAARPAGTAVPLTKLPKECMKLHKETHPHSREPFHWAPRPDRELFVGGEKNAKKFKDGLAANTPHETTYNIEGRGFTAFAAEVGFDSGYSSPGAGDGYANSRLHFEIHVDGKLQTQSGMMSPADAPRLLVVSGLENAKEVRITTRQNDDKGTMEFYLRGWWGDPAFYQK